jgi:lysozyme
MIRRVSIAVAVGLGIALILFGLGFFGVWIPNEPSRADYPIRGIDVSHHQGEIDWSRVKTSGIQFVYVKATEGTDFKDPKFVDNWSGAGAAGIKRGAYHFFRLETSGEKQASNFIATVPGDPDGLPPVIDLEFSGYNKDRRPPVQNFLRELSIFWDSLVTRYRKVPVVYTASDFQKHYLGQMPIEHLWIREAITSPRRSPWTIWQFSSRGRVPGVPGFVDLNVFNGTFADFEKFNEPNKP